MCLEAGVEINFLSVHVPIPQVFASKYLCVATLAIRPAKLLGFKLFRV